MANMLQKRIHRHQLLNDLRNRLMHLHKMLLNMERIAYEQVRGQVLSGELLQLVIHHEQFAWLHRLSELIVQIDDQLQADEPLTEDAIATLFAEVRHLLSPTESDDEFARKYEMALQRNPDVVMAHAEVGGLLAAAE